MSEIYQWDFPLAVKVMLPNEIEKKRLLIKQIVCKEFGFTLAELLNLKAYRRGSATLSDARMAYCYLTRKHLNDQLQRIGLELELTHSSVINLLRRFDDMEFIKHTSAKRIRKLEQQIF